VRDAEVGLFTRHLCVALVAALSCVATACQHAAAHNEIAVATPSPAASPRRWQSDEATLDAAGRAIVAQVRAKMPALLRKCVAWTRVPPDTRKSSYAELPDHGLIVVFRFPHTEGTIIPGRGNPVLYYEGAVHADTNVVYLPNWDQYLLSTPQMWYFSRLGRNDHSDCLN